MSESLRIAQNFPLAQTPPDASAYHLLDAGGGERLEQWGQYRLRRPDPRAPADADERRAAPALWADVDAWYEGAAGRGCWRRLTDVPERWVVHHGGLAFQIKLAPFKHTGLFPEQVDHWRWLARTASRLRDADRADSADGHDAAGARPHVLNLFAYTGGATVALARAGCQVTHVDASRPALVWAKENARLNDLPADAVRWIEDDAAAFVRREVRRGKRYRGVVLDPPAFGRTPSGAVWKLDRDLPDLLRACASLLDASAFVLINDYSDAADADHLATMLADIIRPRDGKPRVDRGRLRLTSTHGSVLDTGAYVRATPR